MAGVDGIQIGDSRFATTRNRGNVRAHNNIFFNYSNDGGSSWLPSNGSVTVNDTLNVPSVEKV